MRLTTVAPEFCRVAGLGLPASEGVASRRAASRTVFAPVARAPVPVVLCVAFCSMTVSVEPSGKTLSVSCRMSLMFFSSDSQKRFFDLFSIWMREVLPPLVLAPAPVPVDSALVEIWVLVDTVPVTSRAMLT